MWSIHEPNTCTAKAASDDKAKGDKGKAAKGGAKKDSDGTPKLKLNKKSQAALAALDKALASGADSDDESQKHESG